MDENNLCFIDGQNLYMGTKLDEISWVLENISLKNIK